MLESLEKMLAKGVDNSLLRFGLGKGYLDLGDNLKAAEHLQRCVEFDPKYSAAWKLLGRALADGVRGVLQDERDCFEPAVDLHRADADLTF